MFENLTIDELTKELDARTQAIILESPLCHLLNDDHNKAYFLFTAEHLFKKGNHIQKFQKEINQSTFNMHDSKYSRQWQNKGEFIVRELSKITRGPREGYSLFSESTTEEVFVFNRNPQIDYEFFDDRGIYMQIKDSENSNSLKHLIYLIK